MSELDQCVIDLHDIARKLETKFSTSGQLSEDIRKCADRLNAVIKAEVNDY
jgi:translation initiation factor 1 (eIF-1/SUI1)